MEKRSKIEQTLKELKPYLQQHFKVSTLGYFGSYAKGKVTDTSDVDLLVEFSETPGWEYVKLKFFLEDHLNRRVDLVTDKALKEQLKSSILKDVKYI